MKPLQTIREQEEDQLKDYSLDDNLPVQEQIKDALVQVQTKKLKYKAPVKRGPIENFVEQLVAEMNDEDY